ncbi:MAG: efflux RND transporter periplasmic adaptor subunit [Nitrospirae bacterium CG08_land_8_20_14_0_20_52_24]|nr:MAG: efflux transporter periplasmic adaptor subunit [Nitrospirae bacterium CG2_30_53_67]PIS37160.1 MAG: efflux RND transporter periplasmic adaptor subunit [Nitrospirae bacterium CG08_land_8_20_14_0_20_52_24]PIX84979.1 MAG: efflux RND transporter periplasmic adaptor subunit [Nitrospirae bacterium CG_4_10_14_3_um_filter_53_41]
MSHEDLSGLKIDKSEAVFRPKRRQRVFLWAGAALLILAAAVLYAKGILSPEVKVEVMNVSRIYPSQTFTLLNASGYVVAQRKAALASKITGRLVSLTVEEGSRVKKGEVIANLESEEAEAVKEEAEANLRISRSDLAQAEAERHEASLSFQRSRDLLNQGFLSKTEYDLQEARYKKAAAAVSGAEQGVKAAAAALKNAGVSLEYTRIRVPFDGVVLTKNADVGDIVTPLGAAANAKASVVTIADMDSLLVEVDVSESNLEQVKRGQPCEIQLDALPESRFRGVVHMIVPTADRSKATVMVKVGFVDQESRILPEMSAKVAFLQRPVGPGEQEPRTAVHPDAVLKRDGRQVVFLMESGRAVETPVTLGVRIGDMVEVTSGVKPGDKVILKPLNKIRDGERIKVVEP